MTLRAVSRAVVAILALLMTAFSAGAQSAADFYKGKTVELYIGYSVGGGYDLYARVLARHFGKHIPGNPTVVPKNMEGAGSLRLANWMAHVAPRDGVRHGRPRRTVRYAARAPRRPVQGHRFQLDRQRQQRSEHLRVVGNLQDHQDRGCVHPANGDRRHRPDRRYGAVSARAQRRA